MSNLELPKDYYELLGISRDYYKVLGISQKCAQEDIEKAYSESRKIDNNFEFDGSVDYKLVSPLPLVYMLRIHFINQIQAQEAYDILKDHEKRAKYDITYYSDINSQQNTRVLHKMLTLRYEREKMKRLHREGDTEQSAGEQIDLIEDLELEEDYFIGKGLRVRPHVEDRHAENEWAREAALSTTKSLQRERINRINVHCTPLPEVPKVTEEALNTCAKENDSSLISK